MRTIFFATRTLVLCSPDEPCMRSLPADAAVLYNGTKEDIAFAVRRFDINDALRHLYIVAEDVESVYIDVCSMFSEVDAAGGVVENPEEEMLMIYRNSRWDLPKGHREAGEDMEVTAVREVEEECGVKVDELDSFICVTDHTYHLLDRHVLKHTWWYRMKVHSVAELTPQTEEGITEVRWLPVADIQEHIKDSYPSIQEVVKKYFISYR